MTKNFRGLISIWLTVIMLLGLMVSPVQVGALTNEGKLVVYTGNITNEPGALVVGPWDEYEPSDGQRFIDTPCLSDGLRDYFLGDLSGFEVWTMSWNSVHSGYILGEKKAQWDKEYVISQSDIDAYDMHGSSESYVVIPVTSFYIAPYVKSLAIAQPDRNDSPVAGDGVYDFYMEDVSVTSGAELKEIPDVQSILGAGSVLDSWEIWQVEYQGSGWFEYKNKIARKSDDWVVTKNELDAYAPVDYGGYDIDYVIYPVLVPDVYVGGVKLQKDVYYVNSDGTVTSDGATSSNYNAYLSSNDGAFTLDINNLDVRGKTGAYECWGFIACGWYSAPESAGIAAYGTLTVNVRGDNNVKGVKNPLDDDSYDSSTAGLYFENVTFTGTGSLSITTDNDEDYTAGIVSATADFTGPQIKVVAGSANDSFGVYCVNDLLITSGTLEAEVSSDATYKYAVRCWSMNYSDGEQPDSNWYKWRSQKDGDWSISSDGNQYAPANDGSEGYVFIADKSYGNIIPGPALPPVPEPLPSSGGGTIRYTVKFNLGDGNVEKTIVRRNKKVERPEDPIKEDYTFDGWYIDKECTEVYDFELAVKKDFTLYAKWISDVLIPSDGSISSDGGISSDDDNHGMHCPSAKYADINTTSWYHHATDYVIEEGYMRGYQNGLFGVNDNLTRAQFVTILWNVEGKPQVNYIMPFADVEENAYTEAIRWAAAEKIVLGVSDDRFDPHRDISREHLAIILMRYAAYKGYDVSIGENTNILSYEDFADVSEYAISAMQYAVGAGIIKGDTESTLNPQGYVRRAEAAQVIQRFVELYN